jgi:hypothetical protein
VLAEIRRRAAPEMEVVELMFLASLSRKFQPSGLNRQDSFVKDRGINGIPGATCSQLNSMEFLSRH